MKLSEVDLTIVKEYLRQDSDEDDRLIEVMIQSAKSHICNYTGQTLEALEASEDVVIAMLVLVADFYDNRVLNVNEKTNMRINSMLEGLLGRHSVNLL